MRTLFILTFFIAALSFAAEAKKPERTLSLIKPDGVKGHHIGDIISRFEKSGFKIAALKMVRLTPEKAKSFYRVHAGKPFLDELALFMSSEPIVAIVLEGEGAVMKNRELMGATDPKKAKEGTLRKEFGSSIAENAVHGSDSSESAKEEIDFFFSKEEIF